MPISSPWELRIGYVEMVENCAGEGSDWTLGVLSLLWEGGETLEWGALRW